MLKYVTQVFLMCMLMTTITYAQQTESRIIGKITDTTRAVLPGVSITVTSHQTGTARVVVSDSVGVYAITNLSPGKYAVDAMLDGFAPTHRDIVLGVGQIETLDVTLSVGLTDVVQVDANVPVLDISSAKIGVNVSSAEIESLPVNGRNFANLMTLATGATTDGNGGWATVRFNGKSNQQNYLSYDGVDGTYVWDATPSYLNATGSQFRLQTSMEAVGEFRVNSGLAPAESGLGSGGNISVVTKSGSNQRSGSVFTYHRNDKLDAVSPYDNVKQPMRLNQFGGSFGGPLKANRTFIFGSYEGLRQTTGLSFTEAVPSDTARTLILSSANTRTLAVAPLLSGFPRGTTPTSNPLVSLATNSTNATQREHSAAFRFDQTITANHSLYLRYLRSDGTLDTPDRTVTPRRILAHEHAQNVVVNLQSIFGRAVNELKLGYNVPHTDATAYGPSGYDAVGVSLSGSFTSSSIDARGTTGIARSGLLIRASSASSTVGSVFAPQSVSFADTLTWNRSNHTFKFGTEYRAIRGDFKYLDSTEIAYNSINDFIANTPNSVAVALDSPMFSPRQYYLIGFAQDSWRITPRMTAELGLRYDFYSVVREAYGRARPFFVEDNAFATDANNFYDPDYNNVAPRTSISYQVTPKTVVRGGFGIFYGPGQFEDRIQPIENYIQRRKVTAADLPAGQLAYPVPTSAYKDILAIRGYTHHRPDEYNVQYGGSLSRELPGSTSLTIGYTGSRGRDMFLRGVGNTLDTTTLVRLAPSVGQVDYKTSGCLNGLVIAKTPIYGCGVAAYDAVQLNATRRFHRGVTAAFQYQFSRNRGTTQGSNEAATTQNTFDFTTEYGTNPQDIPHTFNGSLVYDVHGWHIGAMVNARSGVPLNVTINRPDNITVNGVTVANIPGGNSRGTQRPDLIPHVNPYLKDGVRWLNPAAFATPQPGTFGNLPRNYLRGPAFWQTDVMVSRDIHRMQFRVDVFNVLNHLNYENPAVNLPNGIPGVPFNSTTAGTFGYIMGPLNRTVGLGTARQVQGSIRYSFGH